MPVNHHRISPTGILFRAWTRFLLHFPGQMLLAILGIALGIAVVVSINLAKTSALAAFEQANRTINSRASHRIVSRTNGSLDEQLYRKIKTTPGLPFAAPKISVPVLAGESMEDKINLVGIDPLVEPSIMQWSQRRLNNSVQTSALFQVLTQTNHVIVSGKTARHFRLEPSGTFLVRSGKHKRVLEVAAIIDAADEFEQQLLENRILADIASAQEISGLIGRISYIDIQADDNEQSRRALARLEQLLPDSVELRSYDTLRKTSERMTASFYTNLTALSLLSLLVGMFLIYNTINFMVLRRHRLIGILRAIGATRLQMLKMVILETVFLGILGTATGLLLGTLLADRLLILIAGTINNVYFSIPSPLLELNSGIYAAGMLTGIGAAIIAAIIPAVESTHVAPAHAMIRSNLEIRTRSRVVRSAQAGVCALLVGGMITAASTSSVEFGFAGLMMLVFGAALLTPLTMVMVIALIGPILKRLFGILGTWPARSVTASLSRTGFAAAALMVAIATAIGMQIMITSFRLTVHSWLDDRLNADMYVSADTALVSDSSLDKRIRQKLAQLKGIEEISSVLITQSKTGDVTTRLNVYELTRKAYRGFKFRERLKSESWNDFRENDRVMISESYAYRNRLGSGAILPLATPSGQRNFVISGVYTDYNPGNGIVAISRKTYQRYWADKNFSGFWLYLKADADEDQVITDIQQVTGPDTPLRITRQAKIIEASLRVFDQAFAVTRVLQWLATSIAFIGVFSALMSIQLERKREFGILRSQGITSAQLCSLITVECGLMGLISGLLAVPTGIAVAAILVYVINLRSFGWTMGFQLSPEIWIHGLITGTLAAILAGLYPALRMSGRSPAEALRNE